ncbi:MAG: tandem-95 repeat protein [Planctomycetes bacterium]|nr:tandem-95 repeat protein [Planctomycetota bacterium]
MLARKRPRLTRLAVEPLEERRLLAVMSFQDGVLPTPDYAGTRDVSLFGAEEGVNFGDATTLRADAEQGSTGEPVWSLIKWDLSGIPADATINDVSITVNVTNTTVAPGFNLLAMRTPWIESEATWNGPTANSTWEEPGVTDPADFNPTVLGTMTGTATGPLSVLLNSAGRAVVAGWLSDPASNHGLLISNAANDNSLRFDSREGTTATNRPKLSIDFTFNDVDPPTATLVEPLDNGPADQDDDEGEVRVGVRDSFVIGLDDFALDDATVTAETLSITKDAAAFSDFTFAFDAAADQITLTPTAGSFAEGSYNVTLNGGAAKIADATGNILPRTVLTIVIDAGLPTTPVAEDDAYETAEDTPLVADPESGVLDNDFGGNAPGDAVLVSGPSNGTLELNPDGSFTYTPADDFSGQDSFTYILETPLFTSSVATATITVTSVPDPPIARDDEYRTPTGTQLEVRASAGVLVNDTSVEGGALSARVDVGPQHGTLELTAGGSLSYTPQAGFSGADVFTYIASDGATDSPPASVTIIVNDPPTTEPDEYQADQGGVLIVPVVSGVLSNDSDAAADALTAELVSGPSSGELVLNPDGSLTYTPEPDFLGTDSFTYRAVDPFGASTSATVTINVVGLSPVARSNKYNATEDELLTVDAATGVLANDSDPQGDEMTAVLVRGVREGILTLNPDGSFTYQPNENFVGPDSFRYRASDGEHESASTLVQITVENVNDPPVAVDDAYDIFADTTLFNHETVRILPYGSDDYRFLVVPFRSGSANFSDPSFDDSSFNTGNAPFGSGCGGVLPQRTPWPLRSDLLVRRDFDLPSSATALQVGVAVDNDVRVFINGQDISGWRERASCAGSDNFVFDVPPNLLLPGEQNLLAVLARDEGGANYFDVELRATLSTPSDILVVPTTNGVAANDVDLDGDSLEVILVDDVQHGTLTLSDDGSFRYEPSDGFVGIDAFTYIASDAEAASNVATVTIKVNGAPVPEDDEYIVEADAALVVEREVGLLANDTDPNDDPLSAVLVSEPGSGVLEWAADGSFTYTPNENFTGIDSFTYRASDGQLQSDPATVTINVLGEAPVARSNDYTVLEDETLGVDVAAGLLSNDFDPQGDAITAMLVGDVSQGTLTLNPDGSFTYTPKEDFFGLDTFRYRVTDGEHVSATTEVRINVENVDDPPLAVDDSFFAITHQSLTVEAPGVLAGDSDPDGDPLSVLLASPPRFGDVDLNADGSFTYRSDPGFVGIDTFTYALDDGGGQTVEARVSIAVNPANQIQGVVWFDANDNGQRDPGEPVRSDWEVFLDENNNGRFDPGEPVEVTDNNGVYLFVGLAPGEYSLGEVTQSQWEHAWPFVAAEGNVLIPVSNRRGTVYDPFRNLLYISTGSTLLRYSVGSQSFLSPFAGLGTSVGAIDISPDGRFLYGGDGAASADTAFVRKMDLETGQRTNITFSKSRVEGGIQSLSIAANGMALMTFPYQGSGPTTLRKLDLQSETVSNVRSIDESSTVVRSEDGSALMIFGAAHPYTLRVYDAASDSLSASLAIANTNGSYGAVNRDGTKFVLWSWSDGLNVFDEQLNTIEPLPGWRGGAGFDSARDLLYVGDPAKNEIVVLETNNFQQIARIPVGENIDNNNKIFTTSDGGQLFITTASGLRMISLTPTLTHSVSLAANQIVTNVDFGIRTTGGPAAFDDRYVVDQGRTLSVTGIGILQNDVDPQGRPLVAVVDSFPSSGSLDLRSDGSFTYTPDPEFVGTDSFSYRASADGVASNLATVNITVAPSSVPADLTGNGFVDFEDLTVLLAAWNQNVSAAEGNLVDAGTSPVNFEDLTVLLAAWTGPGPAGAPQAAVRSDRLQPVEIDRMNPVTTSARKDVAYDSDSAVMLKHNLRDARRTAARFRSAGGIYGRLQAAAVDAVLAEEGSLRRERIVARRARR